MSFTAKALLSKAIGYFDITIGSKVDFTTENDKTIYKDPLGNLIKPIPTELGFNRYDIVSPTNDYRQEIHFQNGSPMQVGINGISNEAIIATVLHRLTRQNESFPSPYNVLAIYALQSAMTALHNRVKDRVDFGINDTAQVEPSDEKAADLSKAISIINSLGILGDMIIKFDSAYGLNVPGRIQKYVEDLSKNSAKNDDITLSSGFSLSTTAVMGSGIFRSFALIGSEMLKILQNQGKDEQGPEDNSTGNAT